MIPFENGKRIPGSHLDIHAVDVWTVIVGNIGNMKPLDEDETFDVVIVNRAEFGNKMGPM